MFISLLTLFSLPALQQFHLYIVAALNPHTITQLLTVAEDV